MTHGSRKPHYVYIALSRTRLNVFLDATMLKILRRETVRNEVRLSEAAPESGTHLQMLSTRYTLRFPARYDPQSQSQLIQPLTIS
jgi:hypothetical protein